MIYNDAQYDIFREIWISSVCDNYKLVDKYDKRVDQFASYIKHWNVKSVVFGISGGLDSAFVLDIVYNAIKKYKLDLTAYPVFFSHGLHDYEATPDETYEQRKRIEASSLSKHFQFLKIDMFEQIEATRTFLGHDRKVLTQYAYSLMYTNLFGFAQLYGGITLGSTNKDEMGFVGWFGKNSDMVVDLQLISDFHKVELYGLCPLRASETIPHTMAKKAPTGNILGGMTDEQVFEHSYIDVGFVTYLYLTYGKDWFTFYMKQRFAKLFELHEINAHKYQGQGFNPVFLKD